MSEPEFDPSKIDLSSLAKVYGQNIFATPPKPKVDITGLLAQLKYDPHREVKERFCHIAVASGLVSEHNTIEELGKLLIKYRAHPSFFRLVSDVVEEKKADCTVVSNFTSVIKYRNCVEEIVQLLELARDLSSSKVYNAVWSQFHQDEISLGSYQVYSEGIKKPKKDVSAWYQDVLPIIQGVVTFGGDNFHYSAYQYPFYREVIAHSSEIAHDLKLVDDFNKPKSFNAQSLREYYLQGHKYIYHLDHFGQPEYSSRAPISNVELNIRRAFACLEKYPTLKEQEEFLPHFCNLDPDVGGAMVALIGRALGEEKNVRLVSDLLELIKDSKDASGAEDDNQVLVRALRALNRPSYSKWYDSITLVEEALRTRLISLAEVAECIVQENTDSVEQKLYASKLAEHQRLFPEKELSEVHKAFLTPVNRDSEIVSEEDLLTACAEYQQILRRGQILRTHTRSQLVQLASDCRSRMKAHSEVSKEDRIEFFAVARELFKNHYGVYPYNTQIISALLLLMRDVDPTVKGRYAQIKTGEGKSLLFALISSYQACAGHCVDIVTSNAYLGARDGARFSPFFKSLGLKVGSMPSHSSREKSFLPADDCDIIYGTNQDLIFHYLLCRLNGMSFFGGKRFDTVLIDEADNLCLDLSSESCRIAEECPGGHPEAYFQALIAFADQQAADALTRNLPMVVSEFIVRHPEYGAIHPIVLGLHLQSASGSKNLERNVDYVVKNNRVIVVDHGNTERIKDNTHWSNGLHECVALRNSLPLPSHQGERAQMGHPTFIRKYARMICISGTFGDITDRKELQDVYNAKGFDVPTHHESLRIDLPLQYCIDQTTQLQMIADKALNLRTKATPQPFLVVCQSIQESLLIAEYLKGQGISPQILNDIDNKDEMGNSVSEQHIIDNAGRPGMITIATSVAGRGADIVPTAESKQAGGLEVLLTFNPINLRVENQARGRAGRQGAPGTSAGIVALESDKFTQSLSQAEQMYLIALSNHYGMASLELSRCMDFIRRTRALMGSIQRQAQLHIDERMERVFESYIDKISAASNELIGVNSVFKNNVGLGWFVVSSYIGADWIREYSEAETVLRNQNLFDTNVVIAHEETFSGSKHVAVLDKLFERLYGVAPSSLSQVSGSIEYEVVTTLYQFYAQSLAGLEGRIATFNEVEALKVLAVLEGKVDVYVSECVTKFKRADRYSIKSYVDRVLKDRNARRKAREKEDEG